MRLPRFHLRTLMIAVTQAPWLEPGVAKEIKRRTAEAKRSGDLFPVMLKNADASSAVAGIQSKLIQMHEEWRAEHTAWMEQQEARLNQMVDTLDQILAELRRLGGGNGQAEGGRKRARSNSH